MVNYIKVYLNNNDYKIIKIKEAKKDWNKNIAIIYKIIEKEFNLKLQLQKALLKIKEKQMIKIKLAINKINKNVLNL